MAMTRWTSDELLATHAARVKELRAEGKGRRSAAKVITDETGRPCSGYAMQCCFEALGIDSPVTRGRPIPITVKTTDSEESGTQPIEDLIASRVEASKRKAARSSVHNRTLELPAEPFGLLVVGDPHVDNEGCDWEALFDHITLAQETTNVLGICVGDMQDNWIGRLGKLYSKASVTASDGWRLSKWLLDALQWLAVVGGNHDEWATVPGMDPLGLLSENADVLCYAPDEIRITMHWKGAPHLEPLVLLVRHDFAGRSWFHPTHGPNKEAMLDGRAHVLMSGHLHQWGHLLTEQRHQRVTHALRVRGYKRHDDFARSKGFPEQAFGESALLVVDPHETGPKTVQVFWDVAAGCEFLTWKRAQR